MVGILRAKLRWTGFNGAPGYNVFHFRDFDTPDTGSIPPEQATAIGTRLKAFADAVAVWTPSLIRIAVDPEIDLIESTTGQLQESVSIVPPAASLGTNSAAAGYSAASGAVCTWRTAGVRNGRRVRGRSFLVPLDQTAFQNDGTISTNALTQFRSAATALASTTGSPDLGVYARPSTQGAADGAWYAVTSATVPDLAAILRSRRD